MGFDAGGVDNSNTPAFGADFPQQPFVTTPQHA
jgi:hypothetical protein